MDTNTGLEERLVALIDKQRNERGDILTLGQADPELSEALARIRELVEGLRQLMGNAEIAKAHLPPEADIISSALFDTIEQARALLQRKATTMTSKPVTADDTIMCDACGGSGFGVADTYCGKCGGAGGYPAMAESSVPREVTDAEIERIQGELYT